MYEIETKGITVACGGGCSGGVFHTPATASSGVAYELVCSRGCHALGYMDSEGAWSFVPTGKAPGAREHAKRRISAPVSPSTGRLFPEGRAFRHFG
ncbi:MAG: hypothetical protein ABI592_08890 [Acidobacteriota bacterium]